jgi:hypothetical protein
VQFQDRKVIDRLLFSCTDDINLFYSDGVKDTTSEAGAKAKDLTPEAGAKAKDATFIVKVNTRT